MADQVQTKPSVTGAVRFSEESDDGTKLAKNITGPELELDDVTRKSIWSRQDSLEFESAAAAQDDHISGVHWIVGAAVGLLCITPAVCVGLYDTHDQDYESTRWYACWAPFAVLALLEVWAASWLAPVIGFNMIKERSHGVSLKETMRTNLTTQGLIAALFLTVVYAMLQADPPTEVDGDGDPTSIISQWYLLLCLLALSLTLIGTLGTILLLLYIEPLDDEASLALITWGMMYFGEPVALSTFAFLNTMSATLLWIFGRYGMGAGLMSCLPIWYAAMRSVVIFRYLSAWKNDQLDTEDRAVRAKWGQTVATVGAMAGYKITGKKNEAVAQRASQTQKPQV